jgi:ATP-dependent DNA helicase RecG
MEITELLEIISRGEDSKHQFKRNVNNAISLAQEMVTFSNSGGGKIFIGVSDTGEITGLSSADINRLNGLVSNVASQNVHPPINPQTENIALSEGLIMVITVFDGISKPYMDNQGAIWVKSGADKRKVTSREEMQRMFQSVGLIHGDEIPANGMTVADLDLLYFKNFFEREYGEKLDHQNISLPDILKNMNLVNNSILNISGALLFAKNPQVRLPIFIVKAVSYPDNIIDGSEYLDSQDITGKLADVFQKSLSFVMGNLKHIQGDRNINTPGESEIPRETLEELLVNALIHRDYFISAPIRIFLFRNRVEIISPGYLPNNLTIENIKSGNSNIRNPILASYATKILPYRGLGTGIRRALQKYPEIDFENDLDGNQFKVIIKRKV